MKERYKATNKIDYRKRYLIVLDTETCNTFQGLNGNLDMSNSLVYDIGWAVTDKYGNVYQTRSFLIREIFRDKELMNSAYYKDKIPKYYEGIRNGSRKLVTFYEAKKQLEEDMKLYKTNIVIAHNARFDDNATKVTQRYITKSKYRYFFPYGTEIWDSLKMATDTIGKQKRYIAFCEKNGFMTKHQTPRPRLTAEVLYRFFIQDENYMEEHTALEDVLIEKEIVARCYRTHKAMRKKLYED